MVTERWEKRQYCINQGDWDFGKLDLYRCVCMCQCYARHMHMYKTIMFLFWFCHFPSCHVASVWIRLPELGMPAVLLKRANGLFRLRYCCSSVHTCRTKEVSWHMHFSKYITVWKHFIKDFLPAVPAFLIWEVLVDICLCVYDFFFFLLGSLASNDTLCVMSTLLDASTWPAVLCPEEKKIYLFAQRVLSNHLISSFWASDPTYTGLNLPLLQPHKRSHSWQACLCLYLYCQAR